MPVMHRLLTNAVFSCFALFFLYLSVGQFIQTVDYVDVTAAARNVGTADPTSVPAIPKAIEQAFEEKSTCRSDIVLASATLVLADLDHTNSAADFNAWQNKLDRAEKSIRHDLTCLPANGNLWLGLATIRWAQNAPPKDIASLMQRSQYYSPAQEDVLLGRLAMWNRMSATALKTAGAAVLSDVKTYLDYGWPRSSPAVEHPSRAFGAYIHTVQSQ